MSAFSTLKLDSLSTKKIAASIQKLMQQHDLTEAELARELDIPVMTVRRLVSGETTDPRISTLKLFADYFNVTLDHLTHENNPTENTANPSKAHPDFVPIFTWSDIEANPTIDAIDRTSWEHWQPLSMPGIDNISSHCFALQTKSTMQPRFPQGTLLIIDELENTQDGDLILIRMNDNKISLKEFIFDPPNRILHPIIQGSEPTKYDEKLHKIIGVVILTLMYPRKR